MAAGRGGTGERKPAAGEAEPENGNRQPEETEPGETKTEETESGEENHGKQFQIDGKGRREDSGFHA